MAKKKKSRFKFGFVSGIFFAFLLFFVINIFAQIIKKPTEMIQAFTDNQPKAISQTWRDYGHLFQSHSTELMSPPFLAALAQVESGGQTFASPSWKISLKRKWWQIFAPASSSVGLYQFTVGTFNDAKKYCIHKGHVIKDGPWFDIHSCWFNSFYFRIFPSHSIEMTSAYLHNKVNRLLGTRAKRTNIKRKRQLAAIIHLCGPGRAKQFIRSGFALSHMGKCGTHSVNRYVRRINSAYKKFNRIARR